MNGDERQEVMTRVDEVSPQALRIIRHLRRVSEGFGPASSDLNDAICDYVGVLKKHGLPSGQAVVLLTRAIANSRLEGEDVSSQLEADVVTRCVEEYYRQS